MNLKIKHTTTDGDVRQEARGELKEIIINENLLHPDEESISLCFRGRNVSGIVDITPEEFNALFEQVKSRIHLIKGLSRLSGGGALRL